MEHLPVITTVTDEDIAVQEPEHDPTCTTSSITVEDLPPSSTIAMETVETFVTEHTEYMNQDDNTSCLPEEDKMVSVLENKKQTDENEKEDHPEFFSEDLQSAILQNNPDEIEMPIDETATQDEITIDPDSFQEIDILSPFLYFTHALREELNRSKLCLAVGSCMSDISQIEDIFGKQILKVR
jgi:hypothetical protein